MSRMRRPRRPSRACGGVAAVALLLAALASLEDWRPRLPSGAPVQHRDAFKCCVINLVRFHADVAAGMVWAFQVRRPPAPVPRPREALWLSARIASQEAGCSMTTYIHDGWGIKVTKEARICPTQTCTRCTCPRPAAGQSSGKPPRLHACRLPWRAGMWDVSATNQTLMPRFRR